ncbi:slr2126 [Synechocystis sp. PCC 6803]|uniref:Slr2126 protein n=2 Tax=Synechocystis TaxID=1142 RepID=P73993_SYNY3|nr:hypothetical protein MYO_115010 [Synechocystis sp. PCC 6803]AVP89572.1 glycosyltransferase family 2 protein [Synechocystis sp. IPPAS B-1465]MBD2618698.1 glycosyltransferase family 2 protein [Synechocystis sp. FACHB-898]MBD2640319.1 glycosyltransferase family 2 protein [Synechocystis sp. FACHB-908]MBD2661442.1 glycosyltransferase family 2 protein [Synechocystis sp. FACHB-929]BAL29234.1 hypothetical protein SYNGTI_1487 [Synechocystis sp. PCC 6803 substr. GT-I]BAL32403.1 hypothetical protein 
MFFMQNTKSIYIIIPVHNRREVTLQCLTTLKLNEDLDQYRIVVVDDDSTDGTREAVNAQFPQVIVLEGDGNLWWTGAVKMGMKYAYEQGGELFILLNDDCYPQMGTISKLLKKIDENPNSVIGVQCLDPKSKEPSYGGILTNNNKLQVVKIFHTFNSMTDCDALNGNLLAIPRNIVDKVGFPDAKRFPHHFGDFVYTNRIKKEGYKLFLCNDIVALCEYHYNGLSKKSSQFNRFQELFTPTSQFYWKTEMKGYIELFGIKGIIIYLHKRCLLSSLKVIFLLLDQKLTL